MTHAEKARQLFEQGYNCAQATAGAFAEDMGMDMDTVVRIISPFGAGFGRMREVCGCVSGMTMVAGFFFGYKSPDDLEKKRDVYKKIQDMSGEFREKHGSILCHDLLSELETDSSPTPSVRDAKYYAERPCSHLVEDAAGILERMLRENNVCLRDDVE